MSASTVAAVAEKVLVPELIDKELDTFNRIDDEFPDGIEMDRKQLLTFIASLGYDNPDHILSIIWNYRGANLYPDSLEARGL